MDVSHFTLFMFYVLEMDRIHWKHLAHLFTIIICVYLCSTQTYMWLYEKPHRFPYFASHNHRVLAKHPTNRNYTFPKHNNPSILLVTSNNEKLTDESRLIISVAKSLRIPIQTLSSKSFYVQITKLVQKKSFQLIIFGDTSVYFSLSPSDKEILDSYCKMNSVGVIGFLENPFTLRSLEGNENFAEVWLVYQYIKSNALRRRMY